MAEFKIAYNGNTKAAVREALGQILEYNHYPGRVTTQAWFLVLDQQPSNEDCKFVEVVANHLGMADFVLLPSYGSKPGRKSAKQ